MTRGVARGSSSDHAPVRHPVKVAGVLLAAGAARRFGSPKQLAPLRGAPLLQHPLDALLAARLDDVVVVLGAYAPEVKAALRPSRARVLVAGDWEEGMAASLRRGVHAAAGREADWALVALGDQPGLSAPAVDALTAAARAAPPGVGAVRATYGGTPGHPVVLHRDLFAAVAGLRGDAGARSLLGDVALLPVEVGHLARPDDVDDPADLRRAGGVTRWQR